MSEIVAWRLMFRTASDRAAKKVVKNVLGHVNGRVVSPLRPYWKIPEPWEVSLETPLATPCEVGVRDDAAPMGGRRASFAPGGSSARPGRRGDLIGVAGHMARPATCPFFPTYDS